MPNLTHDDQVRLARIVDRIVLILGIVNKEHSLGELYDHVRAALWEATEASKLVAQVDEPADSLMRVARADALQVLESVLIENSASVRASHKPTLHPYGAPKFWAISWEDGPGGWAYDLDGHLAARVNGATDGRVSIESINHFTLILCPTQAGRAEG